MAELAPTIFTPESQFATGSALDASQQIDRNVRAISAVQASWNQPALPDAVTFDLATAPGMNEAGLVEFMTGLDDDLSAPEPEPTYDPRQQMPQQSGFDQARIILAGVAGNAAPQQVDNDAVREFKRRAIRDGYLDQDENRVDSTWSPELNKIRGAMAYDDIMDSQRGERYGALPLTSGDDGGGSVMDTLNRLTSPTGLLAAATDLDLFWDFGAIGHEASSWGDKWRKLGKSKNPFDFAKNFVDAVTGPIDDIVFPILNWATIGLGIGAAWNGARVGFQGVRLGEAATGFGRLFNYGRIGRNLDEIGEASWTAQRLLRTDNAVTHGLGAAMKGYRSNAAVVGAKSFVQPALRLGVLSQAEDAFPGYQGGGFELSNFDVVEDAQSGLFKAMNNPLFMPLEVLIAPYNIFNPGTFIRHTADDLGLANKIGRGLFRGVGTAPGRAVVGAGVGAVLGTAAGDDAGDTARGALLGGIGGALLPTIGRGLATRAGATAATVGAGALGGALLGDDPSDIALGALAGLGFAFMPTTAKASYLDGIGQSGITRALKGLGDGLALTSFKPLAEDQWASLGFHAMARRALQDQPERLAAWDRDVNQLGLLKTVAKRQGSDEEMAAATIAFVSVSAVQHWVAKAQAGAEDSAAFFDRYHGFKNKITNQLRPLTNLDNITEATISDIATQVAWTERGNQGVRRVNDYARQLKLEWMADPSKALSWAADHESKAAQTVQQLMHPTNFPKLDDMASFDVDKKAIRDLIGGKWASESTEGRAFVVQQYGSQEDIFETVVNFPQFATHTNELRMARGDGLFEFATPKGFKDRFGKTKAAKRTKAALEQPEMANINKAVTDTAFGSEINVMDLHKVQLTPGAPTFEGGRFTVARVGTPLKPEFQAAAEELRDLKTVLDRWRSLPRVNWRAEIAKHGIDEATAIGDLSAKQISQIVQSSKGSKDLGYVLGYAKRKGLSLNKLDEYVNKSIDDLLADSAKWKGLGFKEFVEDADGRGLYGTEALTKRLREVNIKLNHTADEVDVEALVRHLRETGDEAGALRAQQLSDDLARDGYKLSHGVDYLMPEDLAHGPIFGDITRRHLNAASLGNFFKGKLPMEAHILQDRRYRMALAHELDISPEDEKIGLILTDLRKFLREQQDNAERILRDVDRQPFMEKMASRFHSSAVPLSLEDIGRNKKRVLDLFEADHGRDGAEAIWRASKKFRASDFKEVGLYGLEAKARQMNVAEWGLKTLTGSKFGDNLASYGKAAVAPALVGAAVGAASGDTFEEKLKAAAEGALKGAAIGGLGRAALRGGSELARVLPGSGSLVDRSANWSYGYLFDNYAKLRDAMRFTLSPMFDISRYTEGLMLAQTAVPMRYTEDMVRDGEVIHRAGERLAMNLDMSPRGLQRSLRKEILKKNPEMASSEAARLARQKYRDLRGAFGDFARNHQDFDIEAVDGTGQWFRQMGIMGFSPTDWMATLFSRLKMEGFEGEAAYEAAKGAYTYGTRGRSAAEMSANFVFFPFSFQKKALGHIAKWMNDDLARSIIVHDALKTYELLDERYDLDKLWKDHLPELQHLQKLNLFAYGISPGRLGGINAQLFESAGKLAWNLFVPGATHIGSQADAAELKKLMLSLSPAINDINVLVRNMKEEGHVAFSPSHQTTRADVTSGFNEWNEFKTNLTADLQDRGYVLSDIHNKPWLADVKMLYDTKKAELAAKYPAWADSMDEFTSEKMALETDRNQAYARAEAARAGMGSASPTDQMIHEMEDVVNGFKDQLQLYTGSRELTDADPAVFDEIHRIAAEMARKNPYFLWVWEKFYRRELGPLTTNMELAS